ncbi:MAG TPA: hypothetical protein DDY98_05670 [Ruminococcaceae bacterium]|nr:hypothetical protein [Oscillospiraceae bacterium]
MPPKSSAGASFPVPETASLFQLKPLPSKFSVYFRKAFSMLDFHPITLNDKCAVDSVLLSSENLSCEYAFGTIYIWKNVYQSQISICDDIFTASYRTPEYNCYCCPQGKGDFEKAVAELSADAKSKGNVLRINACSEQEVQKIEALFPNRFAFLSDDSCFDYIYSAEALANIAGRKFHDKRNHIAIFERTYPNWTFEEITQANIVECAEMNERWLRLNESKDEVHLSAEHKALNLALADYKALGFYGGLIRAQGKVVAFSFGEKLNNTTFCTHFEKAYADINGAYPLINREMARRLQADFQFINREEDTGAPGLRRAKQSYRPAVWLKKFSAVEK